MPICHGPEGRYKRNGGSGRFYLCRKHHSSGWCPAPTSIRAERIERYVESVFFQALKSPPPEVDYRREQVRRLELVLRKVEAAFEAFRDDERLGDVLDQDQFVIGLQVRSLRVDEARRNLAFARAAADIPPLPRPGLLRRSWLEYEVTERRVFLSDLRLHFCASRPRGG
jgi:hypothetical protein